MLIVPSGSFFHAQTNVSVDITEELSPNVRMIHFPLDIYNVQAVSIPNGLHRPFRLYTHDLVDETFVNAIIRVDLPHIWGLLCL